MKKINMNSGKPNNLNKKEKIKKEYDFFTFLGLGVNGYDEIGYEYCGDYLLTKYVQQIILRTYHEKINRVVVFCTKKSKEKNGEELREVLCKEKPGILFEFNIIDEYISSIDFINELIRNVKNDEIIIDITYMFRHIPMKMMFMIKYIEKSKNIIVSHLFYGKRIGKEEGVLIDFIEDYYLQDLSDALNLFENTLYLSPDLLENHVQNDRKIELLLRTMSALNANMETNNYLDTRKSAKMIYELSGSILKENEKYTALIPYVESIRKKFSGVDHTNEYLSGVNLIRILLECQKLQTAITFADTLFRRILIQKSLRNPGVVLNSSNSDTDIYKCSQDLILGANGYSCRILNNPREEGWWDYTLDDRIRDFLYDNRQIQNFYENVRNKVNHGGKTEKATAEKAVSELLHIIEIIEERTRCSL